MITDLSYLQSMSGSDSTFIHEMVEIFREQISEYSSEMPRLLQTSDFENLSRVAHKAKSSVAVMGMASEAELLKELELQAHEEIDTHLYNEMINRFIERSALALNELDEYLSNQQSYDHS
jgi:HPt (histidine-containing phosphotransfer) domain-containing protein